MAGSGVVIKNTFLEVGDHASLLERSDGWRRQMSEPAKMFSGLDGGSGEAEQDGFSELDEEDEDEPADGARTPELHPMALAGTVPSGIDVASIHQVFPEPGAFDDIGGGSCAAASASGVAARGSSSSGAPASGKPVLLLSESIPPRKTGAEKEQLHRERRAEARAAKDSIINRMKNNDITQREPPWTDVTTVMMRNLPNKYTQQMLLEELLDSGFRLQNDFDFFYLPMDHSNAANLGYCFINFVETAMANAFAAAFQGKKMRRFNSNKTVVVMPASIQGYERNYAYYSSTRVVQAEDPQYRPLFMRQAPGTGQASGCSGGGGGGKGRGCGGGGGGKGAPGGGRGSSSSSGGGKAGCRGGGDMGPPQVLSSPRGFGAAGGGGKDNLGGGGSGSGGMYGEWIGMGGPGAAQPQTRLCGNCRNECSALHRFCAFCGSFIGQPSGDAGAGKGGAPASSPFGAHGANGGMRADAPTFMPGMPGGPGSPSRRSPGGCGGGGGGCSQQQQFSPQHRSPGGGCRGGGAGAGGRHGGGGGPPPLRQGEDRNLHLSGQGGLGGLGGSPMGLMGAPPSMAAALGDMQPSLGASSPLGALPAFQYPDSITDELDVMRGRMMLLAALKDMEQREGGPSAAPPAPMDAEMQERLLALRGGDPGGPGPGLGSQALRW